MAASSANSQSAAAWGPMARSTRACWSASFAKNAPWLRGSAAARRWTSSRNRTMSAPGRSFTNAPSKFSSRNRTLWYRAGVPITVGTRSRKFTGTTSVVVTTMPTTRSVTRCPRDGGIAAVSAGEKGNTTAWSASPTDRCNVEARNRFTTTSVRLRGTASRPANPT